MLRFAWVVPPLAVLLAGCAAQHLSPPQTPPVATAPALSAVVVGARRLAPADLRAPVLQTLSTTGEVTSAPPARPGIELVVQTPDGRTLSCIAHATPPPPPGSTVVLQAGPDCLLRMPASAGAHVAAGGAIR